jgi:hypothetical protein
MRMIAIAIATCMLGAALPNLAVSEAFAQATCRQKCMDAENACLKRTNNKGQCGDRAKTCNAKCK